MKEKIVTAIGGLGNQMFCYAFYKKMCLEYPQICFLMDISDVWDGRYNEGVELLHAFPNVKIEKATAHQVLGCEHKFTFSYRGKGSRMLRIFVDTVNARCMKDRKKNCVTEDMFERWKGRIPDDVWNEILYFDGYWQNVKYYEPYLDVLRRDFIFREAKDNQNLQLLNEIERTDSVSIHIRRGDYVGETLDILDTNYYAGIIKRIRSENPHSIFYFFSNDAGYVEREYGWLDNKVIIRHNCGTENFRDMQLMSACKTNIIANSTFSLWAAMLNSNPDRKVFYPSHYYEGIKMQDIALHGFVKVAVNGQKG